MRWKSHVRFGERAGETGQQKRWTPRPDPTPQRDPRRPPGCGRRVGRLPRGQVGHPGRRRSPPPRPTRHARPAGPQTRPALQDPRAAPPRVEHLTESQHAKLSRCLDAGDPQDEVNLTWQCYQQLRSIYHAGPTKGRAIAQKVLDSFHSCPIPEVARLGRTLRAWRRQALAYFDTSGVSNGGTEAINLIIEKVRRLAHGFRDFNHYRLRRLLAADGRRPYRTRPNHA